MTGDERLTLIQLALGKVSVACMRQSGKVVMPTEALLETAQEIGRLWSDEIATRDARIAELEKDRERLDFVDQSVAALTGGVVTYRQIIDAALAAAKGE